MKEVNEVSFDTQYSCVRGEILTDINIIYLYYIAMYTLTFTIIGVVYGSEKVGPLGYIVPYLILFPLQRAIDAKRYHSLKMSAYLAVKTKGTWESDYEAIEDAVAPTYGMKFYEEEKYKENRKKLEQSKFRQKRISKLSFMRITSVHLGFLCSLLCIYYTMVGEFELRELLTYSLISVLFYVIMLWWTSESTDSMRVRSKYIEALKNHYMYAQSLDEEKE